MLSDVNDETNDSIHFQRLEMCRIIIMIHAVRILSWWWCPWPWPWWFHSMINMQMILRIIRMGFTRLLLCQGPLPSSHIKFYNCTNLNSFLLSLEILIIAKVKLSLHWKRTWRESGNNAGDVKGHSMKL